MGFGLSTGATGLLAYQKMLDVISNNLANANTVGFKASQITFSESLNETMIKTSQPTTNVGVGVEVSGIAALMSQGNIVSTADPLDMAIEGEGYFVLNDGSQDLYTRAGTFGLDSLGYLIDPATGYRVQRIGSEGESVGFQVAGDSDIYISYDPESLPSKTTSVITVQGNLSVDAELANPQTQLLASDITYIARGTAAESNTLLTATEQYTTGTLDTAKIIVSGKDHDGATLTDVAGLDNSAGDKTMSDLIDHINIVLDGNAIATLSSGQIVITDSTSGYSKLDMNLAFTNSGTAALAMPGYFEYSTVGGEEVQNFETTIYDSDGNQHVLSGAFVRTDTAHTWDMLLTSVTGSVNSLSYDNRRIEGIEFNANNGSYSGLASDTAEFAITFAHDTSDPQTISVNLGTADKFDGLTQFATGQSGTSTATIREQDGYEAGSLLTVSVNNEGILIGAFSNGIKKNLAALQIALFQNTLGLESITKGYFAPSANSGEAVATYALTDGSGSIRGGALEKSNTDVASEFFNMIQAQNGFQANAKTIKAADDILKELTSLFR